MLTLHSRVESWPLKEAFTISRGSKTAAEVVVVEISDGQFCGRGECVPYARYGESPETVVSLLEKMKPALEDDLDRLALQNAIPAGAARNALDCAFWDLEAKRTGTPASTLANLPPLQPLVTATTISLEAPEAMAHAARKLAHWPVIKIKLGSNDGRDIERLRAVRNAAPEAHLVVDANEGWTEYNLALHLAACDEVHVSLIEQPLPAENDAMLANLTLSVPLCADESVHDRASLASLVGKYNAINIKLDKTGGLTEALLMAEKARAMGFTVMVGCMVATSLAMAPATLVAQQALVVDLDGPLLLAKDRPHGLLYEGPLVHPPETALWG